MASTNVSSSGLFRRIPASERTAPSPAMALRADIDPPPRPQRAMQTVALVVIVLLACLQFLPATHFRDPADPLRNWIPLDPNRSQPISIRPMVDEKEDHSAGVAEQDKEASRLQLFSWTDCLDLRVLAVLANSTLSSSRYPDNIFFHFFVPENEDEKLSYYKLKVLLPYSNLEITGVKKIKEKLKSHTSKVELLQPMFREILPLVIPSTNKFLYVSPNIIIKGKVEELFGMDLGAYAIAAAEDCSKRLGDIVDMHDLKTIQRTAEKSWVYEKPYDKDACLPDFNFLLLDPRRLEKNLIDAISWWSNVLDVKTQRANPIHPAVVLSIYGKYLKLPTSWKLNYSSSTETETENNVLPFDGPMKVCSENIVQQQRSNHGNLWNEYITPNFDAVLSHSN
ncbi:uncharacterized protein LOC121984856 [Zingiber officinale]|uniref:Hexosyltransferase n=1 Tax=Zingiber officinale TaxID=94328 RepID=A0A8J5GMQ2_ZINOF|nr:uncharacterized protein LOC121984856 [Zingiber officinale]KAG6503923.1 hypothetical protein ZIOFF_036247 [Zingiber officinale]